MNPVRVKRASGGVIVSAVVVAISQVLLVPKSPFEFDEFLFMQSVTRFEPLKHHPHPPGYPLLAGLGKLFAAFGLDPFHALVALSVVSSVVGFVALVFAFRGILRDDTAAIAGAMLFTFSPAMLVDSTLAMSDPPALMFLALALWMTGALSPLWGSDVPFDARPGPARSGSHQLPEREERPTPVWSAILLGVFASASIGCRPQYAIAILPMVLYVVIRVAVRRRVREALLCVVAFTIVSLVWFVPLVVATGGFTGWLGYELKQASYLARHDSFLSRSGRTQAEIALRFVAHPWGPKWLSLPVLLLAVGGAVRELRVRNTRAIPLCIVAAVHLAFSIVATDPADGVRYVLPSMIAVACFAIAATRAAPSAQRWPQVVFATLILTGSFVFTAPILLARVETDSPPVQAAAWARRNLPANAVVLYDQSLEPHADFLLGQFHPMPVERGLAMYADRSDVPLFVFADGGSAVSDSKTFAWKTDSDAFGKLTRNHYFTVAMIPLPPRERFVPIAGVSSPERTAGGEVWRWLAPLATVRLPRAVASRASVVLRLPPEAPIDSNEVSVAVNGAVAARASVWRGRSSVVDVPLPGTTPVVLSFRSSNAYVPAATSSSRDPRKLGVQLVSITTQ